jgi:hypothetical protein
VLTLKNSKQPKTDAMFKFIKQYAEKIEGIEIYPLISQLIFVAFFVLVLVYVAKMKKTRINEMKQMPLDQ